MSIENYLISYIENTTYFNVLIYIVLGYIFYYVFSISFVSIAFLIIGVIIGSYITYKIYK